MFSEILFQIPALASASAVPGHDEAVGLWMSIPFVLLLVLIAVAPLSGKKLKHIWERRYPAIAIGLGILTTLYYVLLVPAGYVDVWHSVKEYISFIALVGSLYVISGGISINLDGEATPKANVIFLLIGAALANLIGTTGASMVLIRPWMKMNNYRLSAFHIVFFIFIISNVGGALTPIGDPPLYIGYLRGVNFFWVFEHANLPWAFVVGLLLVVFYLFDSRSFKRSGARGEMAEKAHDEGTTLTIRGLKNLGYLLVIVCAVFLPGQVSPAVREVLETYFIREIVMIGAAVASYFQTHPQIHKDNNFTFEPIREVGFLFVGIFLTMVPALAYLTSHGPQIGTALTRPAHYFFASGMLSGFLDNTPTYANFFDLIRSLVPVVDPVTEKVIPVAEQVSWMTNSANHDYNLLVVAISLGSVFFGALTYIGNGPNFMVKSIAEAAKVKMPTFFGYILRYSLPILIPVLLLCSLVFLSVDHSVTAAGTPHDASAAETTEISPENANPAEFFDAVERAEVAGTATAPAETTVTAPETAGTPETAESAQPAEVAAPAQSPESAGTPLAVAAPAE